VLRQPSCGAAQALVICAQHVPSRQRSDSCRCVRVWESRQGPRRVAPSGWQEAGAGTPCAHSWGWGCTCGLRFQGGGLPGSPHGGSSVHACVGILCFPSYFAGLKLLWGVGACMLACLGSIGPACGHCPDLSSLICPATLCMVFFLCGRVAQQSCCDV
jgi:hypothetical protein